MPVSICAVIPVYNHGKTAATTVDELLKLGLHCVVVDDGSNEETRSILELLCQRLDATTLCRLDVNQGKGGAVMKGLKLASRLGYTHALQMDADGQHSIDDVPKMISVTEQNPDALIVGQPSYDSSAPKGRLIARNITHFWVGIETLTFQPPDTMCGFRVYPLQQSVTLIEEKRFGRRMDFDTEIMVHLIWKGVPIVRMVTKVIYPEQGVSHFNYFADNVLISWMHSKLFFGMLLRLPRLLYRKLQSS